MDWPRHQRLVLPVTSAAKVRGAASVTNDLRVEPGGVSLIVVNRKPLDPTQAPGDRGELSAR